MEEETIRMYIAGDKLMWTVLLDSYHFRLSTDKLGCVAFGTVNASGQTNFHAVSLSGLEDSKRAFLSVGPAAYPTVEQHSAFLELQVQPGRLCRFAPFEPLDEDPGVFNILAMKHGDECSIATNILSPNAVALSKYISADMAVEISAGPQVLSTTVVKVMRTGPDMYPTATLVLKFSDSVLPLFDHDAYFRYITIKCKGV